ncbi:uncharacterized protein KQ657_001553 [Scheffersomyces spartinae]|uniref:pyridoxal kinase n=1 Tax=Scheffersomyces spartinae TaxID=45513 RepID=A0A9P7V7G0_9ASCO|nr:uncharacterized protein KQ657_001553 [Scheffersomyces spartinae]KAG7192770.1 hypothetical protein KQ657_001553 [Scheffersomyces spartinae]
MKSLLSVQSHVSHGYVGGKAATFPLQIQGWDVDVISTVNFSNHTGYGHTKGSTISVEDLSNIFDGLEDIGVKYEGIVSGYISNKELIDSIVDRISGFKKVNLNMTYLLDPVMGDEGVLYVDNNCVEAYRKVIVGSDLHPPSELIDVITPNQYELELILELPKSISTLYELKDAILLLRYKNPHIKHIVVTSYRLPSDKENIYCAFNSYSNSETVEYCCVPIIRSYFTGIGDLFLAILMDKLTTCYSLPLAVNQTLTVVTQTLELTHKSGSEQYQREMGHPLPANTGAKINQESIIKYFELRIIDARHLYGYLGSGTFDIQTIQ